MKIRRIAVLSLLLLAVTALAAAEGMTTGDITLSGNGNTLKVHADVEPVEGTLIANDDLSGQKLMGVAGSDGTLVVDCTTATDRPTMLILPLGMITQTKGSDTNTQLQAWTEMGHSAVMFDNAYMKTIYGAAIAAFLQEQMTTTLRTAANGISGLWDQADHENGTWMNGKEEAVKASDIALGIVLAPINPSVLKEVNGLPVIGGVNVYITVAAKALNTRNKTTVRTQFTLPAGGAPTGVRVLHEDERGKISPVPATVLGDEVFFDTNKNGRFYVVYDAAGVDVNLPDTGDASGAAIWLAAAVFCAGLAGIMVISGRRRKIQ